MIVILLTILVAFIVIGLLPQALVDVIVFAVGSLILVALGAAALILLQ